MKIHPLSSYFCFVLSSLEIYLSIFLSLLLCFLLFPSLAEESAAEEKTMSLLFVTRVRSCVCARVRAFAREFVYHDSRLVERIIRCFYFTFAVSYDTRIRTHTHTQLIFPLLVQRVFIFVLHLLIE